MKRQLKINTPIILLFGFLLLFQTAAIAAPGDLDTSFAGTGKTRLGFGFGNDFGRAVAVQSDGKLIVAGHGGSDSGGDVEIVRYNADNSLDASFGIGGKVITRIAAGTANIAAVRTQSDGKIVVAGSFYDGTKYSILVVRYNADGSLDTSFDADGIVTTLIAGTTQASAMIIDANGKIVVVGTSDNLSGGSDTKTVLVRYNTNGSPDTSFDGDGEVSVSSYSARGVTLQSDGKIIVVGGFYEFKIARYNTNGSPDTSFGGGLVTTNITTGLDYANAVAIQPNINFTGTDKIVAAGTSGDLGQFAVVRYNLDGTPDTSFDADGIVTTDISAGQDVATSLLIQTIGSTATRIFVAGTTRPAGYNNSDFAVVRYNVGGSPNTGFDGDGIVTTPISQTSGDDAAYAIRLQAGKLVVAGSSVTGEQNSDFAVARYDPVSGALDATFDADGIKTEDIADRNASFGKNTAIQADGKIVVAGYAETGPTTRAFAVARYNNDGTLDPSFDGDGKVTTPINAFSEGYAVAIQSDGKIVVAGDTVISGNPAFAVVRYNTDGTLDTSFGAGGKVTTPIGASSTAKSLAIQSDGKIVVAGNTNAVGSSSDDFAVARYLANGALDSSFANNGIAITGIGSQDQAATVKIQSDGKIVVAGYAALAKYTIALVRYNTNGTLDTSFGSFGRVATDIGGEGAFGLGMAIQTDGKIVVTGANIISSIYKFAVVRYLANGSLDNSFDGDGVAITSIGVSGDVGTAVAIGTNGKIVAAGYSQMGSENDFAVVRYNSNGSLDSSFGFGGKMVVDVSSGSDTANAIALDSYGRAVLVGESNGLFGIVRLLDYLAPTAAVVSISGRVLTPDGRGLTNALVSLTDANGVTRTTRTSSFGYYRFETVEVGQTYVFNVASKRYQFAPQVMSITEDLENLNFFAGQSSLKLNGEFQ